MTLFLHRVLLKRITFSSAVLLKSTWKLHETLSVFSVRSTTDSRFSFWTFFQWWILRPVHVLNMTSSELRVQLCNDELWVIKLFFFFYMILCMKNRGSKNRIKVKHQKLLEKIWKQWGEGMFFQKLTWLCTWLAKTTYTHDTCYSILV